MGEKMTDSQTLKAVDIKVGQIYRLKNRRDRCFKWSTGYVKITRVNSDISFTAIDARPPSYRINAKGKRIIDTDPGFCHEYRNINDIEPTPISDVEFGNFQRQFLQPLRDINSSLW